MDIMKLFKNESGQVNPMTAVLAIIGIVICAAFLVIGVVVLQGIVDGASLTAGDTFYYTLDNITNSIESSIGLAGTLMIVIIGVAILATLTSVLGFMTFR